MPDRSRRVLKAASTVLLLCSAAIGVLPAAAATQAQETEEAKPPAPAASAEPPAGKPRPLGPGDPLPPLRLEYGSITTRNGPEGSGTGRVIASGGASLTFGDVNVRAERIEYDQKTLRIEARGNVVVTRGDETLRGDAFVLEPERDNAFSLDNAVAVSPPFYISGSRIEQTPTGLRGDNGMFTACPEGKGEWRITFKEMEIVNDRFMVLRRPSLYLYGKRILTLPRYRMILRRGREKEKDEYKVSIPVSIRSSRIAGLVVSVRYGFYLGAGYEGGAGVDFPSRRPKQYAVNLRKSFVGRQRQQRVRGSFLDPTMRTDIGEIEQESPLRVFLRARPLPPPEDPVLDFEDILPANNPISQPTRSAAPDLMGTFNFSGNREINDRRQGFLLLSRLPELRLAGRHPFAGTVPNTNEAARAYLRTPRLVLTGALGAANIIEQQLQQNGIKTSMARIDGTIGVGTLPLLIGKRFLFRPQVSYTYNHYSKSNPYTIFETNLVGGFVFTTRTAISGAYIRRFTGGQTPFTFDVIDAQNEGQVRGQIAFGKNGKYTFGALGRYDIDQSQFFDFQLALGIRGRCIEPRFSYRKLGGQFNLTVVLPGLMP